MNLISNFNVNWPADAVFGPGQSDELGELLASRNHLNVLIVTDPGLLSAGVIGRIEKALKKGGVTNQVYADVQPNPTTDNVEEAHQIWKSGNFDALIAVGGGSSIDAGKGVMAQIITGKSAEEAYDLNIDEGEGPTPPFYVLPTTSGTGSESSLGAVLKSKIRKFVIRGRRLQPSTVVMDPELTLSLPRNMTAMTGFDAFCHAIGAWANNQSNPISEEMAICSIRLLIEHLPTAVENGGDLEARAGVMMGSWLAGICIGQQGVDGIHGLATPVESMKNAIHGEVLGVILPHILTYNMETQRAQYALAARRIGLVGNDADDASSASAMYATSMDLKALTGGADRLSEIGIERADIPKLVEMALLSQATVRNGRALPAENIAQLYEGMM